MDLRGKDVLVTGADGFIGSHLVSRLLKESCRIRALIYYNAFNSWGWLESLDRNEFKKIEVFPGDVRDSNNIRKAMKGIDVVFHLAALIGIPFSYHAPCSYVETNIKGTLNVLQAAMDNKLHRILVTSTSEVYGTARKIPMSEDHPLHGQSPYSASKIGADKIAESFFRSFKAPVTIVRPFNTYGPRQSARAVIPTIISQLLNKKREIKLGSLAPKRDFNYVKDVCDGFVAIAKSDRTIGEEINIASGEMVTIGEVARKIIKKINPEAKIVFDSERIRPESSEVMRLMGSNKKIREYTGWKPNYNLDKGLDETIAWFHNRDNLTFYKSDSYNI